MNTLIRTATWIMSPITPVRRPSDVALSNSFGFGGTNGSLVFKQWTGTE